MGDELTRPIIGIENRTAQEVFDIMSDRIRRARAQGPGPGEAVAWRYRHVPYVGWSYASTKPLRSDLEVEPLYAATPTREA